MTIVFNFTPEHAALHINIQDKDLQKYLRRDVLCGHGLIFIPILQSI